MNLGRTVEPKLTDIRSKTHCRSMGKGNGKGKGKGKGAEDIFTLQEALCFHVVFCAQSRDSGFNRLGYVSQGRRECTLYHNGQRCLQGLHRNGPLHHLQGWLRQRQPSDMQGRHSNVVSPRARRSSLARFR